MDWETSGKILFERIQDTHILRAQEQILAGLAISTRTTIIMV